MAQAEQGSSAGVEGRTWRGMWYEFSATTTFHGIHYITEATPYILRRMIWVLIVSGVTAGFVYVVVNRADKYGSHEKNVNVDIQYNATIKFPSVTICNQNYVRMSESYKQGTYGVLSAYFSWKGEYIKDNDERCRHRYVGHSGELLRQNQSDVHFLLFGDLTLDSCRRLCSDLHKVQCVAFSFDKATWTCYISDVDKDLWEAGAITLDVEPHESAGTFHKVECLPHHAHQHGTVRIAGGVVIPMGEEDLWQEGPWTANYSEFLKITGHQKEDMIHACSWQGKPCSADDFEMVMTDYGVCYSFNSFHPKKPSEPLVTSKTGATLGLRLIINVEEYDYMIGPYKDAGIKMFLHDRKELPMVRDLGFAVPPGRHSLIDVRYTNLLNAKPPVGLCGEVPLQYFSNYTWFRCWRDCETKIIVKKCGCIAPYMDSLTKEEHTPVCNMTHYFRCGIEAIDHADPAEAACTCKEPCDRVLYEPLASNAALSSLSIESLLSINREKLQHKHRNALNIEQRVKESRFLETAEKLIHVGQKYDTFIRNIRNKTKDFQKSLIRPIVNSMAALIDIFEEDLNRKQFKGLEEALVTIGLIYGTNRDSIYFVIERVISNTKLVSLHTQNLLFQNFFYSSLESLARETIAYVSVAEKTLPRYNDMLLNVSSTMASFEFPTDVFKFPPERLAKGDERCTDDGIKFYGTLRTIRVLVGHILDDVVDYKQMNYSLSALDNAHRTLHYLYIGINNLTTEYKFIKNNCLEQFSNAVQDVIRLNKTFKDGKSEILDLDYTFDFEKQAAKVFTDRSRFNTLKTKYLTDASISKQELQDNFTEELLHHMIARVEHLNVKIRFQLIERLRESGDVARTDIIGWYESLLDNAAALQEYMPDRFSEMRTRNLTIWKVPEAIVRLGNQNESKPTDNQAFYFTHSVDTSDWQSSDFHSDLAKNTMNDIVDNYFSPMSEAIDDFDNQLGQLEQELTTAIKQLRDLMNRLRDEEELTSSFVLRNFLQVDVYFSELRYQVIQQLEAYTVGDLMGDVGGYMGLLLGASVVTVFELLDVIIYGFILKIKEQATGGRKAKSQQEEKMDVKAAKANNPQHNSFPKRRKSLGAKNNPAFNGDATTSAVYGDMSQYL